MRQIHDLYLEILSLRHPALQHHRNVAQLKGWAFAERSAEIPCLVMEIAFNNLAEFLTTEFVVSPEIKIQMCLDMASGLDAIHAAGIIHADLKPENVLVFQNRSGPNEPLNERVSYIAKLADFGLSVLEAKTLSNDSIQILGFSREWCAPEVYAAYECNTGISSEDYLKADNYSLGLVIWSVFCFQGRPVPRPLDISSSHDATARLRNIEGMPSHVGTRFTQAVGALTAENVADRPAMTLKQIMYDSPECKAWSDDHGNPPEMAMHDFAPPSSIPRDEEHRWAIPDIMHFNAHGGHAWRYKYKRHASAMTKGDFFALFLSLSFDLLRRRDSEEGHVYLRALVDSANAGYVPAQAVVTRVFASAGLPNSFVPDQKKRLEWLKVGARSGCRIARFDLSNIDETLAEEASSQFRAHGAYQMTFCSQEEHDLWREYLSTWPTFHWSHLSKRLDTMEATRRASMLGEELWGSHENTFSEDRPDKVNRFLVIMACLAGCSETLERLCLENVNVSFKWGKPGLTCLHWLFNFPAEKIDRICDLLLAGGCEVDRLSTHPIINHQYPYKWPTGSPLHWAITDQNHNAVEMLIRNGANIYLRNGDDPYRYDDDVRVLDRDGPVEGSYSEPAGTCEGLNAIDIAAAFHDWKCLKVMAQFRDEKSASSHSSQSDEEGYTPFHRLQFRWTGRIFGGRKFCNRLFLGERKARHENLLMTVRALCTLGFDINSLTAPSDRHAGLEPGPLTPLMLAIRYADNEATETLLQCGADVKKKNNQGFNVLDLIPLRGHPLVSETEIANVVRNLLDYGVVTGGRPSLYGAINSGSLESVEMLVAAGADLTERVGAKVNQGMSVLAFLIVQLLGNHQRLADTPAREIISKWIGRDASVANMIEKQIRHANESERDRLLYNVDKNGSSLLHYTAIAEASSCANVLIKHSIEPNTFMSKKWAPHTGHVNYSELKIHLGTPLDALQHRRLTILRNIETDLMPDPPVER